MKTPSWRAKRARTAAVARWCATGQATEAIVARLPLRDPAASAGMLAAWLLDQPDFACLPPAARRIVARGVIRAIEADLLRAI